jgi:hypothetical protein
MCLWEIRSVRIGSERAGFNLSPKGAQEVVVWRAPLQGLQSSTRLPDRVIPFGPISQQVRKRDGAASAVDRSTRGEAPPQTPPSRRLQPGEWRCLALG